MVMTMVQVGPVFVVVGDRFVFVPVGMACCVRQTFMMVVVVMESVMPVIVLV